MERKTWYQVGLELVQVDVQGIVEPEGSSGRWWNTWKGRLRRKVFVGPGWGRVLLANSNSESGRLPGHHRPSNKFMEPSIVCAYDSHSGVEYVGFPNSPAAIGTISRKFASNVASILAPDR